MPSASLDAAAYPGRPGRCRTKASGRMPADPLGHAGVVVAGRQDQDGELLVVLRGQRGKRLFEPGPGVGRDHDGDHGRHLGVHQGAEAIAVSALQARPSGTKFSPELLATV